MSSLFDRLKSGTQQQHRDIESLVDPLTNFSALASYQDYLVKAWSFYESIEAYLVAFDWPALGLDYARRRKAALIEHDLDVLGVHCPRPDGERPASDLSCVEFAVGCLYVVEGATLGGQIISRHLATLGIGPDNGGRFFHGYGSATGEMWKAFQAAAIARCATEDQISLAVSGARATFETFRDAMLALECR